MIDLLAARLGVPKGQAYALCSLVCDLHVTQTVNGVKGVHAMIDKKYASR